MVTAGLKGLNPQVQVEPLSLSITSFPPILVEFAVPAAGDAVPDVFDELPDDVFDELPPQAVTSIATAASAMRQLTRFTLNPPFRGQPGMAVSNLSVRRPPVDRTMVSA